MKFTKQFASYFISILLLLVGNVNAKTETNSIYNYEVIPNDILGTRIYTLDNGFKVYMTVYKDAPRIQTYVAVKTGSKNDPADATGLAHYLEHLLFKGTDKFGTLDFEKEKKELDKIEVLYEAYRNTTKEELRKIIYHQIDSISGEAAKYAIANEYDKMIAMIGSKGNNAFTDFERTVYTNEIPSNQLENWLTLESERFRNPVFRIFHTELEAVYEEKNRSLDSDDNQVYEALFKNLFPTHTYGTQTTIGTIEHLKNPSLVKIKNFYSNYYVPNNMALILAGDFNPDEAIKLINTRFGSLSKKSIPTYVPSVEAPINNPVVIDINGPDAEFVNIAYRFGGAKTQDADMVLLISKIISNGTAGLMDIDLTQKQKVIDAYSFPYILNDYSCLVLGASPKENQTLEEVKNLMLQEIEKLKKGEFEEWMLAAVLTELKLAQTKSYETNRGRADVLLDAFTSDIKLEDKLNQLKRLEKITKKELVDFANRNLTNNYVVVYKHTGVNTKIEKVIKPTITPVEVNRDAQSDFLKKISEQNVPEIEPVFIDYKKDIQQLQLKNNLPVLYKQNTENNTFNLYYILNMGTNHSKKTGVAIDYLQFLGTSKLTAAQVKEEFYKLGCTFEVFNSVDQTYVSLNGLAENFEPAVALFENLLSDAQPSAQALNDRINDVLKKREDNKLSKYEILQMAMRNYAKYGPRSPYTNVLSAEELKALKPEELVGLIKDLLNYQHRILYYGPLSVDSIVKVLNLRHFCAETLKQIPAPLNFPELENSENRVFVVNYDMKQAEILSLHKSVNYTKSNAAKIALFNEYFGGGMGSIVFQTMRESKALAYGVYATYGNPVYANSAHYLSSYIGTQADKLPEAMKGMNELMNTIPQAEILFEGSKKAVMQKIRTERITKADVLFNYEKAKKLDLDFDIRSSIYSEIADLTFSDLEAFSKQYISNKKYTIMVLGDKSSLDMNILKQYGRVDFLSLKDIFGY